MADLSGTITIPASSVRSADLLTVAQYNDYNKYQDFPDKIDETTGNYANVIRPIRNGGDWWLNTAGAYSRYISVVHNFKVEKYTGVSNGFLKVRPVLSLSSAVPGGAKAGDLVSFANQKWLLISTTFVICDDAIGCCDFNSDWKSPYAQQYTNIPQPTNPVTYEKSTVKKYIDDWLEWWKA